jgi:alpha-1,2-mannosyltransferase
MTAGAARTAGGGLSLLQACWLFGALIAVKLIANDVGLSDGLAIPKYGVMVGRDFVNLWVGGKMAWSGQLAHLYDVPAYNEIMRGYFPTQLRHNYAYPPHTLAFGALLALLPYAVALAVWLVGTGALFVAAARHFLPRDMPLLARGMLLVTPAAIVNIWTGQYGFLTGALWLSAFAAIDLSQARSGIAAGLATVKPHLGLLLPAILIGRRRLAAIGTAIVVIAALILASGLLFGFDLWRDYLLKVPATQAAILASPEPQFYFKLMPTTAVALRSLPPVLAIAGQVATVLIALGLLWRARRLPATDLAFVAATATLLILPYAFDYDMTVANLGFGIVLLTGWSGLALWEKAALALAYVLPSLSIAADPLGLPLGPPILLAALVAQVRRLVAMNAEAAGA